MANRFRFHLLTGTDPDAQYAAITAKDSYCFYLLDNGKGYLGSTMLFGKDGGLANSGVIVLDSETLTAPEEGKLYIANNATYGSDTLTGIYMYKNSQMKSFSDAMVQKYLEGILISDYTKAGFTPDNNTVPTTKAVNDLIASKIGDADIVNAKFYRMVELRALTAADIANANVLKPADAAEGDVGLIFTADNNSTDDGDEKYYFISLKDYLNTQYDFANSDSVTLTVTPENGKQKVKADIKIDPAENSILVTSAGVKLFKFSGEDSDTVKDGDGSDEYGPAPDPNKIVTEKAMVDYIQKSVLTAVSAAIEESLADVVTWTEDPPQATS